MGTPILFLFSEGAGLDHGGMRSAVTACHVKCRQYSKVKLPRALILVGDRTSLVDAICRLW